MINHADQQRTGRKLRYILLIHGMWSSTA